MVIGSSIISISYHVSHHIRRMGGERERERERERELEIEGESVVFKVLQKRNPNRVDRRKYYSVFRSFSIVELFRHSLPYSFLMFIMQVY